MGRLEIAVLGRRAARGALGAAALVALAALALAATAPAARAQEDLCANPSGSCLKRLSVRCQRLGAGSIDADCADEFAAYSQCLTAVAERCSTGPAFTETPGARCSDTVATQAWAIAEARKTCGAYQAFVKACPKHPFAAFAENELASLKCAAAGGREAATAGGAKGADKAPVGGKLVVVPAGAAPPDRPGARFRECDGCPEMTVLPGGRFRMGSPPNEANRRANEGPAQSVTVRRFALSSTEVTRGVYARFVRATGARTTRCYAHRGDEPAAFDDQADWRRPGFAQTDAHPAVCVSWSDAQAFARWLNEQVAGSPYRLPSEAELEYAMRAGAEGVFAWGARSQAACGAANVMDRTALERFPRKGPAADCDDGAVFTAPAGSYRANAFGLFDMVGNTYAWSADCWSDSLVGLPTDGAARRRGDCSAAPIRGGAFDNKPASLRSAFRAPYPRAFRSYFVGIRVARSLP